MPSVLIVDDEPDLREILKDDFLTEGFKVYEAAGGEEAFDVFRKERPDAVVTDIRMPQGSGIELLDRIKSSSQKSTDVFLISGFADISEEEALLKGATAIYKKPFDFNELVAGVKKLLG